MDPIDNIDLNVEEIDAPVDNGETRVIITLDGNDETRNAADLGINMDSTNRQILDAVKPMIDEIDQSAYTDAYGNCTFTTRKALNANTILVYPKPSAG